MPNYSDDLLYNNATDGEVFLEAPSIDEGEEGAETWRFIADKGLYHFKKYQGQWLSRRYTAGIQSASEEVSNVTVNSSEINVSSGDIYDLTVTNSLNFTGTSLNLYSFSSPLSLNTTNQAVSLPFSGNLQITNNELDTIQSITSVSTPTFKELSLAQDGGSGGNLTIANNINGKNFNVMLAEHGKLFSTSYVDGSGSTQNDGIGLGDLTAAEVNQLENIDSITITNSQWSYVGNFNQPLATTNNVVFNAVATGNISFVDSMSVATSTNNNTAPINFANKLNLNNLGYTSGFLGDGWSIYNKLNSDNTVTGKYVAEVDDLIVRGSMNVHELVINQIRATNGALIVSDAGKVADKGFKRDYSFTYKATLKFDTDVVGGVAKPAPFAVGDLILHRRVQASDNSIVVNEAKFYVNAINVDDDPTKIEIYFRDFATSIPNSKGCIATINGTEQTYSSDEVSTDWDGATFVRAGSRSNTDRQGLVLITSQDSQAPFIDVIDGVTSWEIWDGVTGDIGIDNGNFDDLPSTGGLVVAGIPNWSLTTSTGSGAYLFASGGIGGGQYIGLRDGAGASYITQNLNYSQFLDGVTYVLEFYAKKNTSNANMTILIGSANNSWDVGNSEFTNSNNYNGITELGTFDTSWRKYKIEFTANATMSLDSDAVVRFYSTGGNAEEVGLDAIRMYAKDKTKVRLGNLAGVGKSGYGLWGDNVFMDGRIEISEGYIGNSENGWLLDATSITALGSNANISIPDSSGNTGYNSGGVYMSGHSTEVFSLGNTSTGNGLTWDGTNLSVNGSITIGNIGNINLSDFNNDLNISGGDYSRFHAFLNSSNGTSFNSSGDVFFCGFDTDGNVSVSANARFMKPDGTFVSLSPQYISTFVSQNMIVSADNNDGSGISGTFRLHNEDGLGYILLDTVGDFGRTGGNARPAGSQISVNQNLSQRLVYVVYNAERDRWYYDDNTANDVVTFTPLSTDFIIAEVRTGAYGSNSDIVGGEPYFIAKQPQAIENYYQGITAGGQNVSWSYQNSAGWFLHHTNNLYSNDNVAFWHSLKQWNFPLIPDGSVSTYAVRITYKGFPTQTANTLKLAVEKSGVAPENNFIATLSEDETVSNTTTKTEVFDLNSNVLVTGEPLIIHLMSNDESGENSGDSGYVYLLEIFDTSTGAGLNDLFPVGDPGATGLFLGADALGYFNNTTNAWGAKIDSSGNFFFGDPTGGSSNSLDFNASTGILELKGLMKAGAIQSSTYDENVGTKIDLNGSSMQMGGDGNSTNAGHYWFEFDTEATVSTMKWKRGDGDSSQYDIVELGANVTNYASSTGGLDVETLVDNSSASNGVWTLGDNDNATFTVDGLEMHQNDSSLNNNSVIKMGKDWNLIYPLFSGAHIGSKSANVKGLALKMGYSPSNTLNHIYEFALLSGQVLKRPIERGTSGFVAKFETPETDTINDVKHMPFHSYLNIGVDWNRHVITTSEGLGESTPLLSGQYYKNNSTSNLEFHIDGFVPNDVTKIVEGTTFNLPEVMSDEATNICHTNIGYAHYGDTGDRRFGKNIGFYAEIGSLSTTSLESFGRANHDVSNHKEYNSISSETGGDRTGNWNTYSGNSWGSNNYGEMHVDEGENILTHCGVAITLLGFGNNNHPNFGHEFGVYVKKSNASNVAGSDNITNNAGSASSVSGPSIGDNTKGNPGDTNQKQNQRSIGVYTEVNALQGQSLLTRGNVSMLRDADGRGNFYCDIATYGSSHSSDLTIDSDNTYTDRGHVTREASSRELKYDEKVLNLNDSEIEDFLTKLKPTLFKWKRNKLQSDDWHKGHFLDVLGRGSGDYTEGWREDIYHLGFIAQDAEAVSPRLAKYGAYQKYDENGIEQPIKYVEKEIDGEKVKYPVHHDEGKNEDGSYKAQVKDINQRAIMAYQQGVIKKLWEKVKELESKIN